MSNLNYLPKSYLPKPTEHNEQAAFVTTVLLTYQHRTDFIRLLFFSTLNGAMIGGSSRGKFALIEKYKSEGWVNGVADLLYLQPRGGFTYLAIEMKTPERVREKNGGASDDQLDWLRASRSAGAMAEICHGAEAAWDVFSRYMSMDVDFPASSNLYHEKE